MIQNVLTRTLERISKILDWDIDEKIKTKRIKSLILSALHTWDKDRDQQNKELVSGLKIVFEKVNEVSDYLNIVLDNFGGYEEKCDLCGDFLDTTCTELNPLTFVQTCDNEDCPYTKTTIYNHITDEKSVIAGKMYMALKEYSNDLLEEQS